MKVTEDTQVTISYTFSTSHGHQLGSSDQSGPFAFVPGRGDTVPGLESRILGTVEGQEFQFNIPATEAYGEWSKDKEFRLDLSALAHLGELNVGMRLSSNLGGRPTDMVITELTDTEAVLDANHPLAGHDIVFTGKVESIGPAPEPVYGGCCGGGGHQDYGGGCGGGGCGGGSCC